MAKMSAEERHKKQLAKMNASAAAEPTVMPKVKSVKDIALEELEQAGYKYDLQSGVPMFNVEKQKDLDFIKSKLDGKGSYGFRYPAGSNLKFDNKEDDSK